MKAKSLKYDKRFERRNDTILNIQSYGETNDYPQIVREVVSASGTACCCLNVYKKFIKGGGFFDNNTYSLKVNRHGETLDDILDFASNDYAMYGGFALHVNYNANYRIVELQNVPFECLRFEKLDENGNFHKLVFHWDWGKRYWRLRRWRLDDCKNYDFFNPDPEIIDSQVMKSGGWNRWNGQILYFSSAGYKVYPLPVFDAVLTDMTTEEGIANVSNRNARNNFLAAGAFVNYHNQAQSADEENEIERTLKEFQGDENACKVMYVECASREEKPEFISFSGENFDKAFTMTLQSAQSNIGKVFNQPAVLRSENVGNGLGSDLMKNAFNAYNGVTENERNVLERVFSQIMSLWHDEKTYNCEIKPLQFKQQGSIFEQLGKEGVELLNNIIAESTPNDLKIKKMHLLFGIDEKDAEKLLI